MNTTELTKEQHSAIIDLLEGAKKLTIPDEVKVGPIKLEITDIEVNILGPIISLLGLPEGSHETSKDTGEFIGSPEDIAAANLREYFSTALYGMFDDIKTTKDLLNIVLEQIEIFHKEFSK